DGRAAGGEARGREDGRGARHRAHRHAHRGRILPARRDLALRDAADRGSRIALDQSPPGPKKNSSPSPSPFTSTTTSTSTWLRRARRGRRCAQTERATAGAGAAPLVLRAPQARGPATTTTFVQETF